MVLQQDMNIPVSGWADPGETINLTLGGEKASTIAGSDGKWRVELSPFSSQSTPLTLTVAGKNILTFTDVLVGDVWVCSGQSNMEFPLKMAHNANVEVPQANDSQMRLFFVPRRRALHPLDDVRGFLNSLYDDSSFYAGNGFGLDPKQAGKWMICTPETAANFSAVGYFFGKDLRAELKRPIGLIGSYFGGSPAESWTSFYGMYAEPVMHGSLNGYQQALQAFPGGDSDMEVQYGSFRAKQEEWSKEIAANPAGPAWQAAHQTWVESLGKLQAAGKPVPKEPAPPIPQPKEPSIGFVPTLLYNGMIAPLLSYAIKGVIWYQGESNANAVEASRQYKILFARMITDWREKWGEGDFPFLFVQLAGNNAHPTTAGDVSPWAAMRETQLKTLSLPNTGMATAVDIGSTSTIHPPDKLDVGHRLALVARHVAYGQGVIDAGPLFESMKIEGNKVHLTFTHAEDGLVIGVPPWTDPTSPAPPTTELKGFAVAGADKNWVWATAKIEGNGVVVSTDQIAHPIAVRYGWADNPECNLYSKAGLPACPFRTDDWN